MINSTFTPAFYIGLCLLAAVRSPADLVINEIHYDPDVKTDRVEFIELYNNGGETVDLAGWYFSSGISWVFPDGTQVRSNGFMVVAENPAELKKKFGADALGPYTNRLSASGEKITLRNAHGEVMDEVNYQLGFPWPTVGEAPGYSLELIHPNLDNDLGGSWRASVRHGASSTNQGQTLIPEKSWWKYFKGTQEPSTPNTAWRRLDFDDSTWLEGTAPIGYDSSEPMGTPINDMRYNYRTLFFRKKFVVTDLAQIGNLLADIKYDDGFNLWINTNHVLRLNVARDEMSATELAMQARESVNYDTSTLPDPRGYLVPGTNIIALQLHNISLGSSSDAFMDLRLRAEPVANYANRGPTPGKTNSVFATNAPPQIRQVEHQPEAPRPGENVVITAKITDPDGVTNVVIKYQLVNPGNYIELTDATYATLWNVLPMYDDGTHGDVIPNDGVFSMTLPSGIQTHRRLVRYRLEATDALGATVTVPYADDPQPNFAYFVYQGTPAWSGAVQPGGAAPLGTPFSVSAAAMGRLPVYHLIAKSNAVANATWFSRYGGDAYLWAGTLVYDGKVYDHIHYRSRGGVWRYSMVKNMWKFDLNRGHDFQARDDWGRKFKTSWTKLNLGASIQQGDYWHRGEQGLFESVGSRLFELAGVPCFKTSFVTFRIIDDALETDPATQYEGDFWGVYLAVEQENGRFLDERGLPDANFYKMESGTGELSNLGPYGPTDKSDLNAFLSGLNSSSSDNWWRANWYLPNGYSYQAIVQAIHHYDIAAGKNYFYYRNPDTGLWIVVPWDLDLTWADNMYDAGGQGGEAFKSYALTRPAFNLEYRNRVREIRDLLFNTEQTYQLIDEYAALLRGPTNAPTVLDADRAQWDYNPKMENGAYSTSLSKAGTGRFYAYPLESATNAALKGSFDATLQIMKNYVVLRSRVLDNLAADTQIPNKPAVTYLGPAGYGLNRLSFSSSSYSGANPFAAIKWRLAEITDTHSAIYDPREPRAYEIETVWEHTNNSYASAITLPPAVVKVGHRYRVRAQMIDTTGRNSNWSLPHEFTAGETDKAALLVEHLKLTELMPQPLAGSEYEYLELYNNSPDTDLDLEGVKFTQGLDYTFGPGTVLAPRGFLLVIKNPDPNTFRAYYQLDATAALAGPYAGSLDNQGETITLKTAANGAVIFSFTYESGRGWPVAADGAGHSLVPLASALASENLKSLTYGGHWTASAFIGGSPGKNNPAPPPSVVLNELMAHTAFQDPQFPEYDSNDWIELYNPTSEPVTLTDYFLSDDESQLKKWALPSTVIPPQGHRSFDEVTGFHQPITSGFGLDQAGEKLLLSHLPGTLEDRIVDAVSFKGQAVDRGWGRYPSGGAYWMTCWPTRDRTNQGAIPEVVISEIHYHPPDLEGTNDNTLDEFIELYNPGPEPVACTNAYGPWRLEGDVEFVFPPDTVIPAKGCVLVVSFGRANWTYTTQFKQKFQLTNSAVSLLGPFEGKLPNDTARVALEKPQAGDLPSDPVHWIIIDEAIYFDAPPWPAEADGSGSSLQRLSLEQSGNDPANWIAATPTAGRYSTLTHAQISGLTRLADGTIRFEIHGPLNRPYEIQGSTNLSAWNPLTNLVAPDGVFIYSDADSPLYSNRFYRVIINP